MNIVLVSTYELGRQPFGVASARAWLEREGHTVTCADLAVEAFPEEAVRWAELIAFHLPMHTATRLAIPAIGRVKRLNSGAHVICFGLYAPLNADLLRSLGVKAVVGGEFEASLVKLARGEKVPAVSTERLEFLTPERGALPDLSSYAKLQQGAEQKLAGYTEASRGCRHLCRHCPIVPVYEGKFRVVAPETVLEDIRRQVAAGAQHVTFGDPDFFNGPGHAMRIVEKLHSEFPSLTYDVTIKIDHLRKHRDLIKPLKDTGCLFVTSAVESVDDRVLAKLEKNHKRRDFEEAAAFMREIGLALQPTFIAFTPWTTRAGYFELLRAIRDLDLVENVAPVQLALRLLVTSGSRLLELDDVRGVLGAFDSAALVYPWRHPAAEVDALADRVFRLVHYQQKQGRTRASIFASLWGLAADPDAEPLPENFHLLPRTAVPYLNEPWYC
jgi:radical SAM superfamily enzyme YgiQ (UPF0313 family)